jgi:hypothetical protein
MTPREARLVLTKFLTRIRFEGRLNAEGLCPTEIDTIHELVEEGLGDLEQAEIRAEVDLSMGLPAERKET